MSDFKAILADMLAEHGWKIVEPRHTFPCIDGQKTVHKRCVEIVGLLFGNDRQAAVCIDSQLVMFFGCGTDYALAEFLRLLKQGKPDEPTPPPTPPKPMNRQKSLF